MTTASASRNDLIEQVGKLRWVHRIDLGEGVVTPGEWGAHNPCIFKAFDDIDFRGKSVLDIGCWDGLFSFEAEKRGASVVYATDLVSQRTYLEHPTFRLAHTLLNSKVRYVPDLSVYDVDRLKIDDFDVVIYTGIYYHLKDPLRSFAMLRRVMKDGGTLLVEGAVIDSPECSAKFFYREPYLGDHSNWWVPTPSCLRQWVGCNFFEERRTYGTWDAGGGNVRYTLTATATRRADPLYIRPDEDLRDYDENPYPTTERQEPTGPRRVFGIKLPGLRR